MGAIIFLLNILVSPADYSSSAVCKDKITTVVVYTAPMNANYYVRMTEETITTLDAENDKGKRYSSTDEELCAELNSFLKRSNAPLLKEDNTIDVRVYMQITYKKKEKVKLSIDRFGTFMLDGKVYEKDIKLLKLIEKHFSEIKWPAKVYE